jgi:hypothetical protein
MSDDHSPGDARKPYADIGGPQARHAQTHDVEREMQTNPTGPEPEDESFAEDLAPDSPEAIRLAQLEGAPAGTDKDVVNALPELSKGELDQLTILAPGTPLQQGGVYLDLENRAGGPFQAIGGQEVGENQRLIAKKTTSYELWNRVAGIDDAPGPE